MRSMCLAVMVIIVLSVVGAGAGADPAYTSANGPAVEAVVVPDSPAGVTETDKSAKKRIHVSVDYTAFIPTDGDTRRDFGKVWGSLGAGRFSPQRPARWAFDWDATLLTKSGASEALLVPVTVGVQRGLRGSRDLQPYVAVRAGPYYGQVENNTKGPDDTKIGVNANLSAGVVVKRRYIIEARYDWFTSIAGNSFNGVTLTAAVKVFDFSL